MPTVASLRSSFFANRPRAALWIASICVAIGLIVAVLVGFRTHPEQKTTSRRAVVAAYIVRVGRIQLKMASQVRAVDRQYKLFAKDPKGLGKRVGKYRQAEHTLGALRRRLAVVKPPREAKRLHTLLLELADENVAVAGAVTGLAGYLPRLSSAQVPLRGAIVALRARIGKAKTAKAQSEAFRDYAVVARSVAERIGRLDAPSFFMPARQAEVVHLRQLSSLAAGISAALGAKQLTKAQKLVGELGRAETATSVARAQRAAALAYNAKLKQITRTAKQIETERSRLERRVPA
jgi:hypothetical protein